MSERSVERDRRVHELFKRLLDEPPERRVACLDESCDGDDELRQEVETLLTAHGAAAAFLETPAISAGARLSSAASTPRVDLVGRTIGHYRLESVIASGGMGTVYLAEQDEPSRRVALKVLNRGIASRSALSRFEFESQILGRLRHPAIAQVYGAGRYDDGLGAVPYFALEFVPDAQSITDYARDHALGTRDRLRLFAIVCDAVHHGHQKGVIHRDLKPPNILIDSTGQPKVIDFGVARATDADMAVTTLQTSLGELIGTIAYMSPEQCDADPDALDTRSDVYSLGVVLYELLCLELPYDVSRVAVFEAARVVREQSPTRPSGIDHALRGDVETIVLKALEKEPDRRYQSAADLADDVRRFLAQEPIRARPPTMSYQLRVFARRNRLFVGALAAVFTLLVTGIVVSTALLVNTQRQARIARSTIEFLDEDLFGSIDDEVDTRGILTLRVVLDSAPQNINDRFADDVLVAASIHTTLGNTYRSLGAFERAEQHLLDAIAHRETALGPTHRDTLGSRHDLGVLYRRQQRFDDAEAVLTELVATMRRYLGERDRDTMRSTTELALLCQDQDRVGEAETMLHQTLTASRQTFGVDDRGTLETMERLGELYVGLERFDEAESLLEECLRGRRVIEGDDHQLTLRVMLTLARLHKARQHPDAASTLFEEAFQISKRVLGDKHPRTESARLELGAIYYAQERFDDMVPLYRASIDSKRDIQKELVRELAHSLSNLAVLHMKQERYDEALPMLEEALELRRHVQPLSHSPLRVTIHNLSALYQKLGRYEEAERLAIEAVTAERAAADPTPRLGGFLFNYGECLTALKRYDEAEKQLEEGYALLAENLGPDHDLTIEALDAIVALYEAWERPGDAATWRARRPAG